MKKVFVLQHVPHEGLGRLETALADYQVPWEIVPLYVDSPCELPWRGIAGLVVLGGPMNVDETDRFPFLRRELDW